MTVTTRRERRERDLRKRQREKRGGHPGGGGGGGPRGWIIGVGVLVLVVLLIVGLRQTGVLQTAVQTPLPSVSALPTVSPVPSNDVARGILDPDYGHLHETAGTPVQYTQLPPTSGSHWPQPAAPVKAGVYTTHVPFEATVHNLEHGGIVIVYNNLTADEVTKLDTFVRQAMAGPYKKVLDEPYVDLTRAKIVLTAWRYHLDLQTVDTVSMQKFIQAHYDSTEAPEPGASW
jgi:hypothetical protein